MKITVGVILLLLITTFGYFWISAHPVEAPSEEVATNQADTMTKKTLPNITPIAHASFVLEWDGLVIYNDPVGAELFAGRPPADIILVSDIHGDHLDVEALQALVGVDTALIAPQAVADELPEDLANKVMVMVNDQLVRNNTLKVSIRAIPMYNLPEQNQDKIYHEEGRGNGYLLERDGARIYIAGDTANTPEMQALRDIDIAFVPMNLPYTMSVEEAAAGVVAFKPKQVYPYHYRTPDGLSDVGFFKQLVNEGAPDVEVVQLDWYQE